MADDIDVREVAQCTCLRLRRTTRRLTQIYDAALAPVDLTIGQFGLLAHLYGRRHAEPEERSIGIIAELLGTDPTTLNRTLKPLERAGFVADGARTADRRVRTLKLTAKGVARFRSAIPLWREAEAEVKQSLGARDAAHLGSLLDASFSALRS